MMLLSFSALAFASGHPAKKTHADGQNSVTLTCAFYLGYQRGPIDPIVSPGVQTSAHSHDFFGRQDISDYMFATAAYPPIANHADDPGYIPRPSSCRNYGDWAGYWFPTPKLNGVNILSGDLKETWQSPAGSTVVAPPFGMGYVVGNSAATSEASEGPHVRFTCGDLGSAGSLSPQDCTSGGMVTAELTYPDCWDGAVQLGNDYFPAGIAPLHFSYSSSGACASGSTMIAQLVTRQSFIDPTTSAALVNPFNADGTLALSFSSGPYYKYHGDFLNSWNAGLRSIVAACLNHVGTCPAVQ